MTARDNEKVSDERLRELRDRQFSRVLNTPRPTIEELEKILQRDDLSVEILPNGEVRAVADTDKEMIVAAIDELLRLRTSQEWQPVAGLLPERDLDILVEQRIKHGELVTRAKYWRPPPPKGEAP